MPGEQPTGILPDQEWAVGPFPDEIFVVELLLDQNMYHGQGARAVAAGPYPQPAIRLLGETMPSRIDDDQLGAPLARLADALREGGEGRTRVGAPEEDAAGVLEIWRRGRRAECVLRAPDHIPRADMRRGQ